MPTLDKIITMQQQGLSETEISKRLQNEGISPTEIQDAFNHAKIKSAVSAPEANIGNELQNPPQDIQPSIAPNPQYQQVPIPPQNQPMSQEVDTGMSTLQASQTSLQNQQQPEIYPPQNQEYSGQDQGGYYQDDQNQDNYYQETPQAYSGQEYYPPQEGLSTETISEIAEQVVSEKFNEFTQKNGDIASFKIVIQDKVSDIDDRLKRIENTIDRLQQSIIGKIDEFGKSSSLVHRDLENLHGTMSKLMNPLIDNYEQLKKITKK